MSSALTGLEVLLPEILAEDGIQFGSSDAPLARARDEPKSLKHLSALQIIQCLPVAVYVTDAEGRIVYFNDAAAEFWGCRPELGKSEFTRSWRLYGPDGAVLPYDESPMAIALRDKQLLKGVKAIAERSDGERVPFLAYPTPLFDRDETLIGAVNVLLDIKENVRLHQAAEFESAQRREAQREAQTASQWLAAIVATSDDGIITKDLNGIIRSWNEGAERLYGYTAEEVVGKPVTILIPEDLPDEEPNILERIRRGERVDHYETRRRRKDGTIVDISLTVSAVKDNEGRIIGASKIARDITDRRRAESQQQLLLREMNHRVKNLFAVSSSVVSLSARWAKTPQDLAATVGERLNALARAHSLTLKNSWDGAAGSADAATVQDLIHTIVSPYNGETEDGRLRVSVEGDDTPIANTAVTSFALLLHEFATNAAKYGALSNPQGRIDITCAIKGDQFIVTWMESGGPSASPTEEEGFGSMLARATVEGQLGGTIERRWSASGLSIFLSVALSRLQS